MDAGTLEALSMILVPIVFILTVGGVALLRPLSKRLGDLLEVMAEDRKTPALTDEIHQIRIHLDSIGSRLALLEDRQDFQEKLLADPRDRSMLNRPAASEDS